MINSKKKGFTNVKGFTIVELVIVIAVIAVLSAVLIPTFSNLVKKANISADQQAVRQMNTALALEGVLGDDDIFSVYDALTEMGMTAKDYKPLTKDTFFFWDQNKKIILHVDNNKTVIAPEQYKGQTFDENKDTWLSLTMQTITTKAPEGYSETSTEITVTTAEELAYVFNELNEIEFQTISRTIDLNGKTIDMMGANISIDSLKSNTGKTLTIKNGTIKNITSIDSSIYGNGKTEGQDGQYGTAGLITNIEGEMNVVLSDLNFENIQVKNTHVSGSGILVGICSGKLSIENVKINNSSVIAHRSTGALVGFLTSGDLEVKNLTMDNVNVLTVGGRSAFLVGYANNPTGKYPFTVLSENIILTNCTYGIFNCEQNTGTSPNNSPLGLINGEIYSWYYDGENNLKAKEYKYIENALIMTSNDSNNLFDSSVTGWN